MLSGINRVAGGALCLYAIAYTAHALFHGFYATALAPQVVCGIFNAITGTGILIAVAVAFAKTRTVNPADPVGRLTA